MQKKETMNRRIFITIVVFLILTPLAAVAQTDAKTAGTINFDGGSCKITEINTRPMWAPAGMKENEKAFNLHFNYTLKEGIDTESLSQLYDKGEFVTPDGKRYKASASMLGHDNNLYILSVAVPKTVDIGTLNFVLNKQKAPLKPFMKE